MAPPSVVAAQSRTRRADAPPTRLRSRKRPGRAQAGGPPLSPDDDPSVSAFAEAGGDERAERRCAVTLDLDAPESPRRWPNFRPRPTAPLDGGSTPPAWL